MVRILGSTGTRRRRAWLALGTVAALTLLAIPATSFADSGTGCDFFSTAKNGTTTDLCSFPLSGSTFAGADGNLLTAPTAFGTTDWESAPAPLGVGIDLASGTGDNSFGQGTKEDNAAVTVVSGSIPPNKSDLTRFYQASETVGANTFLYLAWERTNVLGTANMDFEINQAATPNLGDPGAHTIVRTAGDLLVTFDFTNGGGKPVLGLNTWLTSASVPVVPGFSTNVCLSSNTFPCWGDHTLLSGSIAIGAVNSDAVTDPIQPNSANACPSAGCAALTFGETAINLTNAGVFGTGTCKTFASTFLKSRASSSFPAEVKDFVAPIPTEISNCGQVTIIKHTDPRGVNQAFSYTSNVTGTTTASGTTPCPTPTFTLNDNGNTTGDSAANTANCFNVPAGSYTVTEGSNPTGFVFESLTCSATGTGTSVTPASSTTNKTASITMAGGGAVTCTYVNQQQLGAIKITKTSSKGAHPGLAGAVFSITGPNGYSNNVTTVGVAGTICVDQLAFGTYSVTETAAPTGYAIDDTAAHDVVVNANSTCGDGNEATFSATDTPVWDLQVRFRDGGSGATSGTISCESPTGTVLTADTTATAGWGASPPPTGTTNTYLGLTAPRTVTCTIVIDP